MKLLALLILLAGCDQEVIGVKPTPEEDYNHAKLVAAVDAFIAAQRTPAAYGELAKKVTALRPGMDATVAAEAERRMVVLALAPETSVKESPMPEQINALGSPRR